MLQDRAVHHRGCAEHEAEPDTRNRADDEAHSPQAGVDEHVHDRDENDKRNGVEVLQKIIRGAIRRHRRRHRDQVCRDLVVGNPVEREE